jgi:hypothetical protein
MREVVDRLVDEQRDVLVVERVRDVATAACRCHEAEVAKYAELVRDG